MCPSFIPTKLPHLPSFRELVRFSLSRPSQCHIRHPKSLVRATHIENPYIDLKCMPSPLARQLLAGCVTQKNTKHNQTNGAEEDPRKCDDLCGQMSHCGVFPRPKTSLFTLFRLPPLNPHRIGQCWC